MNDNGLKEEILSHIPQDFSPELQEYVTDTVLLHSRYMFVQRSGSGQQYGYCTHCNKQSKTQGLKHNKSAVCPSCAAVCTVKSAGRGRKYMRDSAYVVWYDKSVKDVRSLVARGLLVTRDYSENYHNVQTKYIVTSVYLFEPGQSWMLDNYWWNENHWRIRKSIISESSTSMQNRQCYFAHQSIDKAVQGTPFQYSTWEHYLEGDMLKFFELAAKYPCIEYLTKYRLQQIVWAKLNGQKTFSAINWRGKTLDRVLKVTRQELRNIWEAKIDLTPYALYLYHQSKKDGSNFTLQEAARFGQGRMELYVDELKMLQQYTTLRKILNYVDKQFIKKNRNWYYAPSSVLTTWKDYLNDCRSLGEDLSSEAILFPTNLHTAHQKTIRKMKIKADAALNEKITKRLKVLDKFVFKTAEFIIRPAKSSIELLDEGKALSHCVGTYSKNYAEGKTDLFVIRRVSDPEKPFYTMEIKNNQIIQVYGKKNCLPTKEVQTFIEAFKAAKLKRKGRKVAV